MNIRFNTSIGIILAGLFCVAFLTAEKILIMTHVYNRPDFIELHYKTFKAFLLDPAWEYIVFNDAPDANMSNSIEQMCKKLAVRCIRVPQHLHHSSNPSARHQDGIRYSLEQEGFDHKGIVLMIDSDMFLRKPLNITDHMNKLDFAAVEQSRSERGKKIIYAHPGLVFMNMLTMPNRQSINFNTGTIEGILCDTGGHVYYYFKQNPTLRLKFLTTFEASELGAFSEDELHAQGFDEPCIAFVKSLTIKANYGINTKPIAGSYVKPNSAFTAQPSYRFAFFDDSYFIHYTSGGSNWPGYSQNFLNRKNELINQLINTSINYFGS